MINRFILTIIMFTFLKDISAQLCNELPDLIPYKKGKLWGYSSSNKKIIIQPQFDLADFFCEPLRNYNTNSQSYTRKYYTDSNSHEVYATNQFATVYKKNEVFRIDKTGNLFKVIEEEEMGGVENMGRSGSNYNLTEETIDSKMIFYNWEKRKEGIKYNGRILLDAKYYFFHPEFYYWKNSIVVFDSLRLFGVIDSNANIIIPTKYKSIKTVFTDKSLGRYDPKPSSNRIYLVTDSTNNISIFDQFGKQKTKFDFSSISTELVDAGFLVVKQKKSKDSDTFLSEGLININGKFIINFGKYTSIRKNETNTCFFKVFKNTIFLGFIDFKGNEYFEN